MNILVTNLRVNIINQDLINLFSVYGEVSYASIVRNSRTGRSKGNAFVEMPNEAEAIQAIAALNRTLIDGLEILVQEIVYKPGEFNN